MPAIILALFLVGAAIPTLAVHDNGLFELDTRAGVDGDQDKNNDPIPGIVGDGNTTDEVGVQGDDWENVVDGSHSADVVTVVEDTFANNNIDNGAEGFVALRTPEISFYTGGGSKDTNGIQEGPWKYKIISDQVPDKNDILNAFAALYSDSNGDPVIYFGLDTFSVNGAANAGFWFFRDDVGLAPLAPGEDTGTFVGEHKDGDFFIAVAYTQGGRVGDIDVYKWVGDDATGSLVLQSSGEDCATVGANDDVCGVINKLMPGETFGEDPVFDYANVLVANNPLDPTSYQYESAAFVEFGLNLKSLFPEGLGCFSTFLAETRSSQSETAQLKDFAFGNFDVCSIDVTKTGDPLSKVGDTVNYSVTIENTGLAKLYKQSIMDSLAGDLTSDAGCGVSLDPGQTCTINYTYTVQAGDADPLLNTVDIVYTEFADPTSLEFKASDGHSVNLFQPSITLDKTGDTLSKVGDDVAYTITLNNTSSADTPDMECTITDALLSVNKSVTLASGASDVTNTSYTVPNSAADPLLNTANASCSPIGFPNVYPASDGHSTDLFQASITLNKTGDTLSKVGDTVDYTITLANTSSASTPDLECTVTDALLGINKSVTLKSGESDVTNASRQVQAADPDPLPNTASASCSPVGYSNVIPASDNHSVNLFQPSITLNKTGDDLSKVGDSVDYTITLNNTSSADTPDMECTITDALLGINKSVTLASGASDVINASRTVLASDADPLVNTASASCSPVGYPNILPASDDHTVNLFQPSITFDKSGDTLSKVGDSVNYVLTLNNTSSADTPDMECTVTDAMLGVNKAVTLASGASDVTNASYTVLSSDSDPLNNTASVSCSPVGFANVLPASDGHSVNLFQPNLSVSVSCPIQDVTAGQDVVYDVTIQNTSSADTPALQLVGVGSKSIAYDPLIQNLNVPLQINNAYPAALNDGNPVTIQFSGQTILGAGDYKGTASVTYEVAGFGNQLARMDMDTCTVLAPAPATLIIEKLFRNGDGVQFTYNTSGAATSTDILTPVLNSTEIAASPFDQTFNPATNGFDRLDGAISVPIPLTGTKVAVSVEEIIPSGIVLEALECTINRDGARAGDISFSGTDGQIANLMLTDLDTAECRWTNFIPGEGCTPGFWRNSPHLWDGVGGDDVSTAVTTDSFNAVFGVTSTESGLNNSVTMLDAVNLGGGNKRALARHAAAAYVSASATGIDFAFSPGAVINIYQDGVELFAVPDNYDVTSAKNALAAENEKGCPFDASQN